MAVDDVAVAASRAGVGVRRRLIDDQRARRPRPGARGHDRPARSGRRPCSRERRSRDRRPHRGGARSTRRRWSSARACGPPALLAPLGIAVPVAPKRHQMCFFRRPPGFDGHPGMIDRPSGTYMRPETGNLTIHGLSTYQEVVDPDQYNEGADPEEVMRNAELIAQRFPVMEHGLSMGGYSGVYDVTPDHEPILGPIPEFQGFHADFGWSGHGFKHSPAIGEIMAEVVLEGRATGWDLPPFRWSRFQEGDLLPPASATDPPHPKLHAAPASDDGLPRQLQGGLPGDQVRRHPLPDGAARDLAGLSPPAGRRRPGDDAGRGRQGGGGDRHRRRRLLRRREERAPHAEPRLPRQHQRDRLAGDALPDPARSC